MFPLTTTTIMTQEVYERYSWVLLLRRKQLYISIGLLEMGLLILATVQFWDEEPWMFAFFLALMVIVPLALLLRYKHQIKRVYKKNPVWQDAEQEMSFYEDHLIVQTKRGDLTYDYNEISEIIVTEQDFYVMLGKHTGFPIEKSRCSKELQHFLLELKANPPQTRSSN